MCGIIGILGTAAVSPLLLDGLRRLEYRGYDSAGIATLVNGRIERRRAEGKLVNLSALLEREPLGGTIGIGHTRWATHGRPSQANAHPHADRRVAVVHNGIIENFQALRRELEAAGQVFDSETDTEVIVHLLSSYLDRQMTPEDAVAAALPRCRSGLWPPGPGVLCAPPRPRKSHPGHRPCPWLFGWLGPARSPRARGYPRVPGAG